ncbi:hypothetical protein ACOSP7_026824 [Xanthoceras sorbifolium]
METPTTMVEQPKGENSILVDLTSRMAQVMNQNQTQNQIPSHESLAKIGIKLDGTNYALWSQIVEMYVSGKDKKWRTENAVVKRWLINSMDPRLVSNFIRFPTAKAVWDNIATMYFDGTDMSQVYVLKRKREIDFRRPNPMVCDTDIQKYNSIMQEDRVYTFLDGLDERLDKIRGDVLQIKPFPTVERAYAQVRREDLRQSVMMTNGDIISGGAMLSRVGHKPQQLSFQIPSNGKPNTMTKPKLRGEGGGCTHCGNMKHTSETCFKLHGYPVGGMNLRRKRNGMQVEAKILVVQPFLLPLLMNRLLRMIQVTVVMSCSKQGNHDGWIIDSWATDHMRFDSCDFSEATQPKRICIANANGVTYPVTGAGTILTKEIIGREEIENAECVETESEQQPARADQSEETSETENEQLFPYLPVPPKDQSRENIPEVQARNSSLNNFVDDSVGYRLPFKHYRGKPPDCYSPDHGKRKSKYLIANHIIRKLFLPVTKLNTMRVLISLATNLGWPLHQFDVKNAFFHEDLKEEVYMDIPPSFATLSQMEVVCNGGSL